MDFNDRSVIAGVSKRESDGALIADVRIARTGIQYYLGKEVDPENKQGLRDRAYVSVYRPGSEVFSADTMRSAAHRPVTNNHPKERIVNADNWKKTAVGQTADEVTGEGIYLRVPLMVSDASAIADVESGKRELSAGYTSDLDFTAGVTPAGESYDAVQRNIRINHVAIVHHGRAGSSVRIGDAAWGVSPVDNDDSGEQGERTMDKPLKTVTVDGLSIEVTDQGAQVITKLQAQLDAATASSAKVLSDHAAALAVKDAELAKKDAVIDGLKAQVFDAAKIDALVAERADLIGKATRVHKDVKTAGLTNAQIKHEAVRLAIGDAAVKDKPEAYIDARFDILVEGAKTGPKDTFAVAATTGIVDAATATPAQLAYAKMIEDQKNATMPKAN